MAWTEPKTDWTDKNYCNIAADFNRVEGNTAYLAQLLNSYGYFVSVTAKTDWTRADFPTVSEVLRIKQNVQNLLNAYYAMPGTPTIDIDNYFDYTDANALEINLEGINTLLEGMVANFRYSGDVYAGEGYFE